MKKLLILSMLLVLSACGKNPTEEVVVYDDPNTNPYTQEAIEQPELDPRLNTCVSRTIAISSCLHKIYRRATFEGWVPNEVKVIEKCEEKYPETGSCHNISFKLEENE